METSYRSKVWKRIREWKQVEHRAQCLLYLEQNSKICYPYSDCYLINHYKTDAVRIGITNVLEFCSRYNKH